MTYEACMTADPVPLACTNAHNLDRLVQFGIPAGVLIVTLLAVIATVLVSRR